MHWNLPIVEATGTVPNFHTFYTTFYLQEHPLHKNQAAMFSAILDSFLLSVDCIQHGWVVGVEDGKDGGFKILKRKM